MTDPKLENCPTCGSLQLWAAGKAPSESPMTDEATKLLRALLEATDAYGESAVDDEGRTWGLVMDAREAAHASLAALPAAAPHSYASGPQPNDYVPIVDAGIADIAAAAQPAPLPGPPREPTESNADRAALARGEIPAHIAMTAPTAAPLPLPERLTDAADDLRHHVPSPAGRDRIYALLREAAAALAQLPPRGREYTDAMRSVAFNYAEGFAGASTVTTAEVLDAYYAIRDAALHEPTPTEQPSTAGQPKRYRMCAQADGGCAMEPDPNGEWIAYVDHN